MRSNYEDIAKDNIRRRGDEFDDIGEFIAEQLYSDRAHFLYELLQNCDDAIRRRARRGVRSDFPRSITFRLFRDRLEVRHFGKPFDEPDVRGISDVLRGTKRNDPTQIGRFGIGFKSVYTVTSSPEVHSGDEHFLIERYIRPCATEAHSLADGETLFILPFNHKSVSADEASSEIGGRCQSLDPRTLLFVQELDEITWAVEGGLSGTYRRRCEREGQARRVVLTSGGADEAEETWLVFERPLRSTAGCSDSRVEVAYRVTSDASNGTRSIDPAATYPLTVFFPTMITTGLGFAIQGPYVPTPPRDNIHRRGTDGEWNRGLIAETATLVAETLPALRAMGLLSVRALEAMPVRPRDFPEDSMFRPIFDCVRETLSEHDLLPAHGGGFVAGRNAKLAESTDLRALLSLRQLRQLFGAGSQLKWLSGEITGDLRTYLVKQLAVGEVTADSLTRRFDESFVEAQSDDWVAKFYCFLSKRDVWEKGGPLRDRPFIRLEDGRHVAPFQDDGSPNAYLPPADQTDYPTIKRVIVENKKACQFLTNLGLAEPDIVDEVIKSVLPRYDGTTTLSPHQHDADLRKIFSALKTDSQTKRKRLFKQLETTPFFRASNAMTGATKFCTPGELYRRTDELELYFAGNTDAWFLDEPAFEKLEFVEDVWQVLRVESVPRLQEFEPKLSWKQIADLQKRLGYSGRIDVHDRDLHGLRPFLKRIDEADEPLRPQMACVLWTFLVRHLESRGSHSLFFGRYSWFYYKAKGDSFDARLARRLRNAAWLPDHGKFKRPCEVSLDDLPDNFERDSQLAEALQMRAAVSTALAREIGVAPDDIEYLRTNLDEFRQWRAGRSIPDSLAREPAGDPVDFASALKATFARSEGRQKGGDSIPPDPVTHRERYQQRIHDEIKETRAKEPPPTLRFKRAPRTVWETKDSEVRTFLLQQYDGKCQICGDTFRRRDGEPYFEGLYLVSRIGARWIDRRGNVLCLCAMCCAKFQHGSVEADDILDQLQAFGEEQEAAIGSPSLSILLCGQPATIRFSERHMIDLREMLKQ